MALGNQFAGLKWPIGFSLAGLAISAGLVIWSADFGDLAAMLLVVPLTCMVLLFLIFCASRQRKRSRLLLLAAFLICASLFQFSHSEIRERARWLIGSRYWKAQVQSEQAYADAGLRSVIWDGWGMFAQDTDVYLVFDPTDELKEYSPSQLHGLPCPVWMVHKLEPQWYSVTFYTNTGWSAHGDC